MKSRRRGASAHLIHAFASPARMEADGPLTLVKGKGVYVWDEHGRKYLDGLASLWNVTVGHGRAEIARAIAAQTRKLSYAPTLLGFSSEPAQRLAERGASLAPTLRRHAMVGDVRSAGLMGAIELVRDRDTKAPYPAAVAVAARVRAAALSRGVIVRMSGDVVAVCPPLIIEEKEIDRIVAVLDESIAEVSGELHRH